ncbi:MAG: adenylate/guanylate cyclase domain-containing protein, partial [Candidatus Marinimicrobia bacterium]|nr:adenylate/guanylate cyclase domain-containing protein [Candidatus Neomarinimicrobiota bacterium]MBT5461968.1 adenylate/guanylate cyclase domain-containing protein [Candidatus Neomarinimicrobiota bacterium]MBT6931105.1 adenylate/guanylate cyclase domain-containing protein [Candidatus Neomarinimicrobiota bacterium]MBT7974976.1 adenylate/guanylate cyclase domain-containing protein [Candidatus Neomarinimicrobiota bacterium]
MNELLKRLSVGALIGLLVGLVIGFGTNIDGFFLTDLLSGYEYQSYDARMRASVAGSEEASIDTVVIIDIEQQSTAPTEEGGLGRYYNWPQAYHGQLIDVVTSGEPAALLFDIIFDPENTFNFDLVNALNSDSAPEDEFLADVTNQFLSSNDPTRMVTSTYESQKTYHALVFEAEDTLNFLYKMDSEPDGYDRLDHIIQLPIEQASRLPRADRLGNTYTDLLQASARTGSANFPQDEDGVIRRCPTVIWFEGPNHVYPSLTLAAAMDMLGIPNDGLDYDFDKLILTLRDTSGITVREIPIDEKGRMYVNYFGYYKTFYYLPYMYCIDPDILDPSYWKGKVVLVGASLPGLMDLRNTPVQETFAGVEIHANVIHSILQNQFVSITSADTNLWLILMICISLGVLVSISSKPLYTLPIPLVAIIAWIIFTYNEFFTGQVMWEIIRPTLSMGSTYLGIFLYNFLVVEKDKRFLKNTFGTYISPELIEQMIDEKTEPQLGGEEAVHTALFTDIQSFSSFSEKLSPIELVELLNDYLTEMTNILLDNNGTLDKYVGDAIIAFYGAPMPVENHEYQACITAIKMQTQLKVLRKKWKAEGDRWPTNVHGLQNRI